jgi:hypothetical protein
MGLGSKIIAEKEDQGPIQSKPEVHHLSKLYTSVR